MLGETDSGKKNKKSTKGFEDLFKVKKVTGKKGRKTQIGQGRDLSLKNYDYHNKIINQIRTKYMK